MHCFFVPFFWTFVPLVVELLGLVCSPSLGSKSFGLGHLFMSSGLQVGVCACHVVLVGWRALVLLEGASDGSS